MANSPGANSQNSSNLQALLNQLTGSTAPQTANSQLQYNLGQTELGLVNPELNANTAYNKAMTGYQAQNLGLSEQGLGIQQTALGERGGLQATQQGIEQQSFALQQGQFPEQQAEAALTYQNALRGTQGSQAISGTQNTVGGKADITTLGQEYAFQTEDIARAQALSGLGQQSEQAGYTYSQEELANAKANLALNAQANGISEQQLLTMLNYGNAQAGEGAQQNIIQLLAGLGGGATGQLGNVGAGLSSIGFASGLNALAGVG